MVSLRHLYGLVAVPASAPYIVRTSEGVQHEFTAAYPRAGMLEGNVGGRGHVKTGAMQSRIMQKHTERKRKGGTGQSR